MLVVNRFEANLLQIVTTMLSQRSPASVMLQIQRPERYPGCLSEPTVRMLERLLARGITHGLASQDAWTSVRFMRRGVVSPGPLWHRTPPENLGLKFSKRTLQFLVWLVHSEPLNSRTPNFAAFDKLTLGDQLVIYRVLTWLRRTPIAERWLDDTNFAQQPLVALQLPGELTAENWCRPNYSAWMEPPASCVLECWQSSLATAWIQTEREKSWINDPVRMQRLGRIQAELMAAYLDAAESAGRRDLARFVIVALAAMVGHQVDPQVAARNWVRGLNLGHLRLADRTEVYRGASTFLATAARLRQWTDQCRQTGYFDDGYPAAQLWLADWERYDGERVTQRALAISRWLTADLRS